MDFERNMGIQQGAGAAVAFLAAETVFMTAANELGMLKLPVLAGALAFAAGMLTLYDAALKRLPAADHRSRWNALTASGMLLLTGWFYWGIAELWHEIMGEGFVFPLYTLLPLSLLLFAGYRGEKAVMRCAPLLCFLVLLAVVFDTLFLSSHIEATVPSWVIAENGEVLKGMAELSLCLLAPGAIFLSCRRDLGRQRFKAAGVRGMAAAAGYMVLQTIRDLLLFGDLTALEEYPILRTLKSVELGVGVSRLEFFGLCVLSMAVFAGIMLGFAGLCRLAKDFIGKESRIIPGFFAICIYCECLLLPMAGKGMAYIIAAIGLVLLLAGSLLSGVATGKEE